jgi:hypothetical protein
MKANGTIKQVSFSSKFGRRCINTRKCQQRCNYRQDNKKGYKTAAQIKRDQREGAGLKSGS